MKLTKDKLFSACKQCKFSIEQSEHLWKELESHQKFSESSLSKFLLYLGGMIVISTMTLIMNYGLQSFEGQGLFLIAIIYATIFTFIGAFLWKKKELKTPGGILITMAVCMTPLAVHGLETFFYPVNNLGPQRHFPFFQEGAQPIYKEMATIIIGLIALYFFRFPFLVVPILFASLFFILDIIPFIFPNGLHGIDKLDLMFWISLIYGLSMITLGFFVDRIKKSEYGFWIYLFGTFSFFIGLNGLVWDKSNIVLLFYAMINFAMMIFSLFTKRIVLMVFGSLGVFSYLSYLSYNVFKDSIAFPFVLSFIGLLIIGIGILFQSNHPWIEKLFIRKFSKKTESGDTKEN